MSERRKWRGKLPWAAVALAGSKMEGRGSFGVGNEEKERVLPNESFLLIPLFILQSLQ